jgi:hypothetical protein
MPVAIQNTDAWLWCVKSQMDASVDACGSHCSYHQQGRCISQLYMHIHSKRSSGGHSDELWMLECSNLATRLLIGHQHAVQSMIKLFMSGWVRVVGLRALGCGSCHQLKTKSDETPQRPQKLNCLVFSKPKPDCLRTSRALASPERAGAVKNT